MCQPRLGKVNQFFSGTRRRERKLQLIRWKKGGRGEGICGRAKTFVNKLRCDVADERATPGEQDPAPRRKSGAAPAKSRKSHWHKQEKNHPLLMLNNSPGPPNTIPPLGWRHGRVAAGLEQPRPQMPAWLWDARLHPWSSGQFRRRGQWIHLQLLDFLCSSSQTNPLHAQR